MGLRSDMGHLAARLVGSLSRSEPPEPDVRWLEAMLLPAEVKEFESMSVADRRHAVECARRAEVLLGSDASPELIVAAALHDVGKTEAHLGTLGRVGATLVGRVTPSRWREGWLARGGWPRAIAVYLEHDVRGAARLEEIGSSPLAVAWAREHHLAESDWTVPTRWGRRLAEADLVSSLDI